MAQKIYVDRDYLATELAKKANTSHASSSTTYGASSASNYGHAKASSTTPKANGTAAVGSETSSFARGDHVHPLQTTVSGNAGSASKVNNNLVIKLNSGSTEGTNLFTFNGSAAKTVNVTPSSINALALTGGTLSGKLKINGAASEQPLQVRGIVGNMADGGSVDGLYLQYGANKEVYFGNSGAYTISADGSNYTGNAATATILKTSRTINGTSFNGSANITTANWGTARNLTIGNKTQSVNGSGNVTWSLADIGASASGHTHSYLPLSGGTLTGNLTLNQYLKVNAWSGYGSGTADMWYDGTNKTLYVDTATTLKVGGKKVSLEDHTHPDGITSITKSLTVGASWMDTGIAGSNLSTGTYAVQMFANTQGTGGLWSEYFSGIMTWYGETTNSGEADEILLHKAGHAPNGQHLYLRTLRNSNGTLKLQICAKTAISAAISFEFKFKKLI